MRISDDVVAATVEVLEELASEIDLWYSNDQLRDMGQRIGKIYRACELLDEEGFETPDACKHILDRFALAVDSENSH